MDTLTKREYLLSKSSVKNVRMETIPPIYFKKKRNRVGESIPRKTLITVVSLRKSGKLADLIDAYNVKTVQ